MRYIAALNPNLTICEGHFIADHERFQRVRQTRICYYNGTQTYFSCLFEGNRKGNYRKWNVARWAPWPLCRMVITPNSWNHELQRDEMNFMSQTSKATQWFFIPLFRRGHRHINFVGADTLILRKWQMLMIFSPIKGLANNLPSVSENQAHRIGTIAKLPFFSPRSVFVSFAFYFSISHSASRIGAGETRKWRPQQGICFAFIFRSSSATKQMHTSTMSVGLS